MRVASLWIALCVIAMLGCAQPRPAPTNSQHLAEELNQWPDDWTPYIGKKVTLIGVTQDGKGGSTLKEGENSDKPWLWLDGQHWSDKFCPEPLKGTHAQVTAVIIKRKDWEVIVDPTGRHEVIDRFWLTDATWTYLD